MTGVVAPPGRYRIALAELPLSTRLVDDATAAILVVPGARGWADAARAATNAGAVAIVIADPEYAPAADIRALAQETRIPVIVERPMLRADSAADARAFRTVGAAPSAPRMVVVDGTAARARLSLITRDAVGWLRVLAGGELALVAADTALALLETRDGVPAMLSVVQTSPPARAWIRAQALGETSIEVQDEGRGARVLTATASGTLVAPPRFESSERVAVRRALAALTTGDRPDDMDELASDTELAEQILLPSP